MTSKSAFQVLLEHFQQLMRQTDDRTLSDAPVTQNLLDSVDELEKVVSEFKSLSDQMLQALNVTPQELREVQNEPPASLNPTDAATLRLGQQVYHEACRKYAQLSTLLQAIKTRGQASPQSGKSQSVGKARQKKFRRVGGRDKWMPL